MTLGERCCCLAMKCFPPHCEWPILKPLVYTSAEQTREWRENAGSQTAHCESESYKEATGKVQNDPGAGGLEFIQGKRGTSSAAQHKHKQIHVEVFMCFCVCTSQVKMHTCAFLFQQLGGGARGTKGLLSVKASCHQDWFLILFSIRRTRASRGAPESSIASGNRDQFEIHEKIKMC